jgi:hypothetical protein
MFIPGDVDGLGAGVAGPIVTPGMGAVAGVGAGFAAFGAGVAFFAGAGVAIGIPGIGAIVGWAAKPGETVTRTKKAATLRRVASKSTSRVRLGILQFVVYLPEKPAFASRFRRHRFRRTCDHPR